MPDREALRRMTKETLIDMLEDSAKNWLAHDGLWFQAAERRFGIETAIELDADAWKTFTAIEAQRIMRRHSIAAGGGLKALAKALDFRRYARLTQQSTTWPSPNTLRFEMNTCRVQDARHRKGLPDFPCKPVGLVEYAGFASAIDPRIQTRCIACPPDPHPDSFWCAWEFTLPEEHT